MIRKIAKWMGLILCSTAVGLAAAIYGIAALLLMIAALGGYAVWCLADFEDAADRIMEETAEAVANAIREEQMNEFNS